MMELVQMFIKLSSDHFQSAGKAPNPSLQHFLKNLADKFKMQKKVSKGDNNFTNNYL